eukprot:9208847-Heterocapsa_arctica.AAC.1
MDARAGTSQRCMYPARSPVGRAEDGIPGLACARAAMRAVPDRLCDSSALDCWMDDLWSADANVPAIGSLRSLGFVNKSFVVRDIDVNAQSNNELRLRQRLPDNRLRGRRYRKCNNKFIYTMPNMKFNDNMLLKNEKNGEDEKVMKKRRNRRTA